ncbi:MAG: O-antigen ligase family protein [Frankiaceae bacterium]|nr:O-antigen ligase family protein [Frankiaceae bacterium]MBV9870270.1 O-antigen ligase family protein [Frankiaceae bacterium]
MTRAVWAVGPGAPPRLGDFLGWTIGLGTAAFVFADLSFGGLHAAELTIGGAVTLLAVLAFVRWPGMAIGAVLVFVPLQVPVLAYLYKHGMPGVVARDLGYLKDAAILGVGLCAVLRTSGNDKTDRWNLDLVDKFAIGYVGIATAYLLLPLAAPGALGGEPWGVRLGAWRIDCLFAILLLAAKRVSLSMRTLRRIRTTVFVVAATIFGVAIWESVSSDGYNRFLVRTLGVPIYQIAVLHTSPPPGYSYVVHAQEGSGIRVGSLLLDPLVLGFFMVLPLAYGLERLSGSRPRLLPLAGVAGGAVSIVMTQTRSAILSGGVVILLSVWLAARRRSSGRLPLVILLVGTGILLAPYLAQSSAWSRIQSNLSVQTEDNQQHITRTTNGFNSLLRHPAGFGLGANPATGVRSQTANATNTENSYLGVGSELGAAGMLCFIGFYVATLVELRRRAQGESETAKLAGASWLAGFGLLVGGLFLPIWISFPVALTFWGLAGLGLARPAADDDELSSGLPHTVATPRQSETATPVSV